MTYGVLSGVERERLVRNIGIRYRRVCKPGQIFSDLAQSACEDLLKNLKWSKDSVQILLLVTQSSDYIIPSTSIILQDKIGFSSSTLAFDINLGCSGYPYGLIVLGSLMKSMGIQRGIVLVGDQSSSSGSPDSGREILFSDCGTATGLELDPSAPDMFFDGFSDGSGALAIYVPHGGKRNPAEKGSHDFRLMDDGVTRKMTDVHLDGPAIMNFSIGVVPDALNNICLKSGIPLEKIDYFVLHQANKMINETIRKKMKMPEEKFPLVLYEFGNTSSATIPITISYKLKDPIAEGEKFICACGFGIGLSWASLIFKLGPDTYISPVIEA
ncbi:MAG: ketoacyl-ACP synthase III [Sphingobacteriales bacterium]|nr:ketoacyl-ACP synthase III [Sphingobacteriales bacterium]